MGRSYQEQLVDLELGRADLVEISPLEARRAAQAGLSVSSSPAAWLIALVFLREHDPRLREAVALSIDRAAIANVLLQRHAAPAGALLPAWLTGYAVVFPTDLRVPPPVKGPVLSVQSDAADPLTRAVAERVAVNVREAGIRLNVSAFGSDARVARVWVGQLEPRQALLDAAEGLGLAGSLRLPLPATLEELHAAERALVEEYRVVPLVHIPEIHAAVPRLRAAAGWRLEDAWLEPR
jgi:hypothetical protein